MIRFVLIIALVIFTLEVSAQERGCSVGRSVREVSGPSELIDVLHNAAADAGVLFREGGFYQESFRYIGSVTAQSKQLWHVVFIATTWGEACRASNQLLVFSAQRKYVGRYSGIAEPPTSVVSEQVIFRFARQSGNSIAFGDNGPPDQVRLDGEIYDFER